MDLLNVILLFQLVLIFLSLGLLSFFIFAIHRYKDEKILLQSAKIGMIRTYHVLIYSMVLYILFYAYAIITK